MTRADRLDLADRIQTEIDEAMGVAVFVLGTHPAGDLGALARQVLRAGEVDLRTLAVAGHVHTNGEYNNWEYVAALAESYGVAL